MQKIVALIVIWHPLDSNCGSPSAEWRLIIKTRIGSQNENFKFAAVFEPVYSPSVLSLCNLRMLNYERFPDKVCLMNKKSQNMIVPDFLIAHRPSSVLKHLYKKYSLWLAQGVDSRSGSAYKTRGDTLAAPLLLSFQDVWPRRESMMGYFNS